MKLIIDISEEEMKYPANIIQAVKHGIPLDEVKADIAEEICPTDNPYTGETAYTIEHSRLLDILDNIGKEVKDKE